VTELEAVEIVDLLQLLGLGVDGLLLVWPLVSDDDLANVEERHPLFDDADIPSLLEGFPKISSA
jgi:hypothetical protein